MSRSTRPAGALVAVLSLTLVLGGVQSPAFAVDYPTWEDVEAAKQNESLKRAEIAKIEALISGFEAEAAATATAALEALEAYNQAVNELEAATASSTSLRRSADAARTRAEESAAAAGSVIAQLTRSGGNDVTLQLLLASEEDADDLLYRLGALEKLSEHSLALLEQASLDHNGAEAASERARVALDRRTELAGSAEQALAAAQTAADEAADRAANQDAVAAQLYAQLASLKGTSAAIEQGYLDGLAWEEAQNAVTTPPAPLPEAPNPPPPAPNTGAVDSAIAFALAQVGDPYVIRGTGPDGWDCAGLTLKSYAAAGVGIGGHGATSQYNFMAAAGRLVPYDQIVAGDLLFYSSGGATGASKYHVAMFIGNGQMIEAPYPGKTVRVTAVRFGDLVPYAGRPTP